MRTGILVLLTVVLLVGCNGGKSEEVNAVSHSLPVRWTKLVELESLDNIDSTLDRAIVTSNGREELILVKATKDGKVAREARVHTVRDYLRYSEQGYEPRDNHQVKVESWFLEAAVPAQHLAGALPSRVSYVKDLDLSRRPLLLPPELCIETVAEASEVERLDALVAAGKGWREIWPRLSWKVGGAHDIEVGDSDGVTHLTVLAWGDFNRDGIEDVLLNVSQIGLTSSWRSYRNVILTRRELQGRIEIVAD